MKKEQNYFHYHLQNLITQKVAQKGAKVKVYLNKKNQEKNMIKMKNKKNKEKDLNRHHHRLIHLLNPIKKEDKEKKKKKININRDTENILDLDPGLIHMKKEKEKNIQVVISTIVNEMTNIFKRKKRKIVLI